MKTLRLKVIHRLLLRGMLNDEGEKKGHTLSDLNAYLKVLEKINFTDEERDLYNVREEDGRILWNTTKDATADGEEVDVFKEFELSDEQGELVKKIFDRKNEDKEFTLNSLTPTLEIAEQLGVVVE